jgi:Concanavalin A-like lectin/glucanases superfamily
MTNTVDLVTPGANNPIINDPTGNGSVPAYFYNNQAFVIQESVNDEGISLNGVGMVGTMTFVLWYDPLGMFSTSLVLFSATSGNFLTYTSPSYANPTIAAELELTLSNVVIVSSLTNRVGGQPVLNIQTGSWLHLVITYNSVTRVASMYQNGVLVAQNNAVGAIGYDTTPLTSELVCSNPGSGYTTIGLFYGLRIYNISLTAPQVVNLFNTDQPLMYSTNPLVPSNNFLSSLTSYLPLNGDMTDLIGNSAPTALNSTSPAYCELSFNNATLLPDNVTMGFPFSSPCQAISAGIVLTGIYLTPSFSMCGWFQLTANPLSVYQAFILFGTSGLSTVNGYYFFEYYTGANPGSMFWGQYDNPQVFGNINALMILGTWYHICMTYNATNGISTMYTNAEAWTYEHFFPSQSGIQYAMIGSNDANQASPVGYTWHFTVHNVCLSASDILSAYLQERQNSSALSYYVAVVNVYWTSNPTIVTDTSSHSWSTKAGYATLGGTTLPTLAHTATTITGTSNGPLYQYWYASSSTWTVTYNGLTTNSIYNVTFLFVEDSSCSAAGCRIASFLTNGVMCLNYFDIYASVLSDYAAYSITCPVFLTSPTTSLVISAVPYVSTAKVSSISVVPSPTSAITFNIVTPTSGSTYYIRSASLGSASFQWCLGVPVNDVTASASASTGVNSVYIQALQCAHFQPNLQWKYTTGAVPTLVSVSSSSFAWNVYEESCTSGNTIQQMSGTSTYMQFTYSSTELISTTCSGLCLTLSSLTLGATLTLQTCSGASTQQFSFATAAS